MRKGPLRLRYPRSRRCEGESEHSRRLKSSFTDVPERRGCLFQTALMFQQLLSRNTFCDPVCTIFWDNARSPSFHHLLLTGSPCFGGFRPSPRRHAHAVGGVRVFRGIELRVERVSDSRSKTNHYPRRRPVCYPDRLPGFRPRHSRRRNWAHESASPTPPLYQRTEERGGWGAAASGAW